MITLNRILEGKLIFHHLRSAIRKVYTKRAQLMDSPTSKQIIFTQIELKKVFISHLS
jgi:hypothetical protein